MAAMELNLGSPRTQAAMKVLGVHPKDVKALDPAEFEGKEAKQKMIEQKRLNVIQEVQAMVAKSPDVTGGGKKPLMDASSLREAKTKEFIDRIDEQERANFERLQTMAKKDVQSIVIGELKAKKAAFVGKKKQEESHQRLKELTATRDAELKERKKAADKKQEKNTLVRDKANTALAAKNVEVAVALQKAGEKCDNNIRAIAESRVEGIEANEVRRKEATARQGGRELALQAGRETAYKEHVSKHNAKLEKLEEARAGRASHAAEIAEKQQESTDRVRERQEKTELESRMKYFEICGRHQTASHKRDETLKSTIKYFTAANQKRRTAHVGRHDKIQAELEKSPGVKRCASAAPGSPTFIIERAEKRILSPSNGFNALQKSQSESRIHDVMDHRRNHGEVVATNNLRLRRAHHYMMDEQIDKLHNMRQRVDVMRDAKKDADDRRMVAMRNTSLEKMKMTDKVARVRDSADPAKMQQMLEELDPDRDAVDKINGLLGTMGQPLMSGGTPEAEQEQKK